MKEKLSLTGVGTDNGQIGFSNGETDRALASRNRKPLTTDGHCATKPQPKN
jgi:hypothetical protein